MIKVGDTVRVLPNKKVGKVTDISDGFVILDDNQARPYMPQQLELELKRYVLFDTNKIIDTVLDDYILLTICLSLSQNLLWLTSFFQQLDLVVKLENR